ncbi:hypothetical protein KA047_02210 [Candidatus Saccharibacteria bacterium]|nr:hypothetical protein [Candidatus Saccharibacteria bacterium]
MLDRSKQYKALTTSIIGALLFAALIFFALTVLGSTQASASGNEIVAIGPLQLLELAKVPVTDGYKVSIELRAGLAYYITIALGLGVCIGYLRSRSVQPD